MADADQLESASEYGALKGAQAANQMTLNLNQARYNIDAVQQVGLDEPDYVLGRSASGGGSGIYSGGEYDNFRRSENIDDRRRQKYSQDPWVADPNYHRGDWLNNFDFIAADKNVLSQALGGDSLSALLRISHF